MFGTVRRVLGVQHWSLGSTRLSVIMLLVTLRVCAQKLQLHFPSKSSDQHPPNLVREHLAARKQHMLYFMSLSV